jgi:hypothetical protein
MAWCSQCHCSAAAAATVSSGSRCTPETAVRQLLATLLLSKLRRAAMSSTFTCWSLHCMLSSTSTSLVYVLLHYVLSSTSTWSLYLIQQPSGVSSMR